MVLLSFFLRILRPIGATGPLCFFLVGFLASAIMLTGRCSAYVLPPHQLIGFMAANFEPFETIVIQQFTEVTTLGGPEQPSAFEEIVTMKSPDLFRVEPLGPDAGRTRDMDHRYRRLLIANRESDLKAFLSRMGIDMEKVFFTRVDGVIAYCIGDRNPESPKILIEKERFLPLLLTYRRPGYAGEDVVRVRFKDYRQVEQGWYPFEITYSSGWEISERYIIQSLRANAPVSPTYFDAPPIPPQTEAPPDEGGTPSEEERLNRIIRTFEEKYGR
jgi:hypothetical protein